MRKIFIEIVAVLMTFSVCAEEKVYLWPSKKGPGSEQFTAKQVVRTNKDGEVSSISSVSEPYFTVHKAKKSKNKKTGIIMFAPGGYRELVMTSIASTVTKYCAEGYTCFVMVNRLPLENGHEKPALVALQDAQRAIRLIRSEAKKYGIAENKIGVFGFSAGGHVAASLATRFEEKIFEPIDDVDSVSARPDFQVLRAPMIALQLAGEDASCIPHVTANTPKAFIAVACDDNQARLRQHILPYYEALFAQGVDSELHIFQNGDHKFDPKGTNRVWEELSINWLNEYVK